MPSSRAAAVIVASRALAVTFAHAIALLAASPALAADPPPPPPRPANFGQQWVRAHPLTLMGLQQWPHTNNMSRHQGANMTNLLVWWADGNGKQIAQQS